MNYLLSIILFLLCSGINLAQTLKGTILDKNTQKPLEYVQIGIVNKLIGTLTNASGEFTLPLKDLTNDDEMRITMIGYQTQALKIAELKNQSSVFLLTEDTLKLQEVIITPKTASKTKIVGGRSTAKNMVTGGAGWGLGGERGTKIGIKKNKTALVKNVQFYLPRNQYDSAVFRLHIRTIKDGQPHEELLKDNIFISLSKHQTGWVIFDLSSYQIVLDQDVAVTLEGIKVWSKLPNQQLHISMGLLKGPLYGKLTSQSKWEVHKSYCPSIALTLLY